MSYAEIVASGPKQSPEEARAPPVPSITPEESASSLVDVDSPHVSVVPSDFEQQEVQTTTQADRIERETEDKARVEKKKAEQKAEELKQKTAAKAKEAKTELKKDAKKLQDNKDNPVFVGNGILWTVAVIAVGYGAYKRHSEGKLDLQFAGTVVAGLGVLGAVDYFGSKWLVENKYPTK